VASKVIEEAKKIKKKLIYYIGYDLFKKKKLFNFYQFDNLTNTK